VPLAINILKTAGQRSKIKTTWST